MAICGVAVAETEPSVNIGELDSMLAALATQPDEARARDTSGPAALGATSPLGTTSQARSGPVLVACDAEVYNHQDLQQDADVLSSIDAATLIATLYLKRSASFLGSLRGIFAIAIWDERSRSLLLARDRLGVHPLCYASTPSGIVFASHPRGIFAGGRLKRSVNQAAIVNYINYAMVPAPESAFEGLRNLGPGEYLLWTHGNTRCTKYWDMQYTENAGGSEQQLACDLLAHMEDAVRTTSRDLDLEDSGCFLSGGTDSSSIVGLLTGIHKQSVNTFSIGFADDRFNELEYAHIAVRHYNAKHHERILGPDTTYDTISIIVNGYDEPFGNASAIPTYCCTALAREAGIDVLLAGDGGDELFGGNERYRKQQLYAYYSDLPRPLRRLLIEPITNGLAAVSGAAAKVQRHIAWANIPHPERYSLRRLIQEFAPEQFLGPDMPRLEDRLAVVRSYYRTAPAKTDLNRLLYIDMKMTLADDDLRKVVRTAELLGVKVRFPYLDHVLAEFSGRLPAHLKVRRMEKRYLFKMATRNLLPAAIIRKKKHGFSLPIGVWLKTDATLRNFSRDVLFDPRTYQRGYFRRQFIETVVAKMDADNTPYFGELLFELMMLELWYRRHVEGAGVNAAA